MLFPLPGFGQTYEKRGGFGREDRFVCHSYLRAAAIWTMRR
jgi:hypothetical protein